MKKTIFGAAVLAAVALAFPVFAAPVPPAVEAMIRAAGDDTETVVRVAKAAHPGSAAEIDTLAGSLAAQREAARIERLKRAGVLDAWSGSGELGVNYTTGNTRDTGVALGIGLAKDGIAFRHKIGAFVDWQRSNGVLARNRYAADYELNYKFNERLYLYALAGWERNTFAGFTHRFTESGGAGYSLIKREDLFLDVTAGPVVQQTRYLDGRMNHEMSARAALDFGWKISDDLEFTESAAVVLGGQWTSTTALTYALTDALSSRASFDLIHESEPPLGRRATDTATRLSLVYGF